MHIDPQTLCLFIFERGQKKAAGGHSRMMFYCFKEGQGVSIAHSAVNMHLIPCEEYNCTNHVEILKSLQSMTK